MTEKSMLKGGCLCGALRYSVSGSPFDSDYCHCRICQKSTGAFAVAWMDFKVGQINWLKDKPVEYASSEPVRRGFCNVCGSTLSFRDERYPEYLSLSTASLDDPNRVAPRYHIYTDSQPDWLVISDNCKRYPQSRDDQSSEV